MNQSKRLIETELPVKEISLHSVKEKLATTGSLASLHTWWARRPLSACRAVICASLWYDPVDSSCPKYFQINAYKAIKSFALAVVSNKKKHTYTNNTDLWEQIATDKSDFNFSNDNDKIVLQKSLLCFIADFANKDNANNDDYLLTSRLITTIAHASLGNNNTVNPLILDPFAGGGSIPFEAMRIGGKAHASDINPIAALLNKIILEYIPQHKDKLQQEVSKWGDWIKQEAIKRLKKYYIDSSVADVPEIPVFYIWARKVKCSNSDCNAEIPLLKSLWLAKNRSKSIGLKIITTPGSNRIDFEIIENLDENDIQKGPLEKCVVTCPCCGTKSNIKHIKEQLKSQQGGAKKARLVCVVYTKPSQKGKFYRLPNESDYKVLDLVHEDFEKISNYDSNLSELIPKENTPDEKQGINLKSYGLDKFDDVFTERQLFTAINMINLVKDAGRKIETYDYKELAIAVQVCLAVFVDKMIHKNNASCYWDNISEKNIQTFRLHYLRPSLDFTESNLLLGDKSTGDNNLKIFNKTIQNVVNAYKIESLSKLIPKEKTPDDKHGINLKSYGLDKFDDFFSERQLLTAINMIDLVKEAGSKIETYGSKELAIAVQVCLAVFIDKMINKNNASCTWEYLREVRHHKFSRQALRPSWDFTEESLTLDNKSTWDNNLKIFDRTIKDIINASGDNIGTVESKGFYTSLPDKSVDLVFSDPPYFDYISYSDLSDFFYVWLKRSLPEDIGIDFSSYLTPKNDECIVDKPRGKDKDFFNDTMRKAMEENLRVISPNGIAVIVFANKSIEAWITQVTAMIDAGWYITKTWTISTESPNRLRALNSSALSGSVHMVCRPRSCQEVGDWDSIQKELKDSVGTWRDRLALDNVEGIDRFFALLGDSLEIFTRYPKVIDSNSSSVGLREYFDYLSVVTKELSGV